MIGDGWDMNHQIKALQLSVLVHAAAIILLIAAGNHFVSKQERLLVVDFTLSDSSELHHGLSMITPGKRKTRASQTKIAKQVQELPAREPETPPPVKQEVVPVKEEIEESPVTAQVPAVTQNEETVSETEREKYARSTSSGHGSDKSLPSGGGTKVTSTGNSESAYIAAGAGYLKANFSYIRDMIIKKIIYPERAREMGWQGKVKVSFVISSNGFVQDIRILESSGVEILDKNAVETVKKASPFPRPPVAAQLIIPISYRLH
jgi:protein TonB